MADYSVKGKVTDPNGNPIPGIKVEMIGFSTTTTSDDGSYNMKTRVEPPHYPAETVNVAFSDIDSTENGLYKNDTIPVTFYNSELTGGDGHWYEGSATKTLNVSLLPVEE